MGVSLKDRGINILCALCQEKIVPKICLDVALPPLSFYFDKKDCNLMITISTGSKSLRI